MLNFQNAFSYRSAIFTITAIGAPAAALILRQMLVGYVGDDLPTYITFYPALVLVALSAGFWAGLLTTVITAVLVSYWVLPPQGMAIGSFSDAFGLAFFVCMSLLINSSIELHRRTRQKTAAYEQELILRDEKEAARRKSEELEKLIDLVPAAIWIAHDPQCRSIIGNAAANQFYGPQEKENVAAGPTLETRKELRRFFRNGRELKVAELPLQEAAAKGMDVRDSELNVVLPSGGTITMLGNASPLYDDQGQVRGGIAAFVDITERKQIEEAQMFMAHCNATKDGDDFFKSLARYLAETLEADFVCIDRLEGDCLAARTVAVFFNGKFEDNVAYALKDTPCGDVVGKMICVFPRDVRHLFPRDLVLQEMIAESYVGATLWSSQGRPIGLIAIISRKPMVNIKIAESILKLVSVRAAGELERRQAEEEIRELTQRLNYHVDHSPLAVIEWGPDMRLIRWSGEAERIFGWSAEEILGKRMEDIRWVYNDDEDQVADVSEDLRTGKNPRRFSLNRNYCKDGSVIYCEWYNSSMLDEQNNLRSILSLVLDVTDRKKMEEAVAERAQQLEAANKELESFSYSVSHDLRAPLRAIDGYSRMILKKQGDKFDEETARQFNLIRDNSRMMDKLIDDLLDFSRIGRQVMAKSNLDMGSLIRDVWGELQTINPDRHMTLNIVDPMPQGMGDKALMKQVLSNILLNAIKFAKVREEVLIETGGYVKGNETVYYVKDNGVGFDMQYYHKLFCVFQRLHPVDDYEGTGIGLALVQRIIHRHGGQIWAESEIDRGTCFYFTLPGQ